jgi:DNA-binding CsgD family transcriptional regulator
MKRSNALAHIRQLCGLGLGAPAIMPALLRSVRALVPCDSAGFFWVDANGELVNLYAERLLPPEQMRRYFERHYASPEHAFRERLMARAGAREFVGELNVDSALENTQYFADVLRPLGAYRILHAIVHDNGQPLGQLSLYRGRRSPRFTAADHHALETVSRYIAHAIGTAPRAAARRLPNSYRDSELEALVVCSTEGEISTASYRAYALLAHAGGEPINRSTMAGAVERAWRSLLKKLAAELHAAGPMPETPPAITVDNAWGRFRLRAYTLSQYEIGVLIQRLDHLLVRVADAMLDLPLSAQQREVAILLAQGLTNSEIAGTMGVTINTASYHVKQLFQKLDAHDRTEAIARILDGHTARHR